MNYTIAVLDSDIKGLDIEKTWTDENTGKTYKNVFAPGNPCMFPPGIKEGDSFYFSIDTAREEPCMICEAYYPKPSKKLNIKVEAK